MLRMLMKAVEVSPISIVISDCHGTIEYANPAFFKTTGYTQEEALGQNAGILNSGKHPKSFFSQMWNDISSGNHWQGEICNKKKDGTLFWENVSISPIANANNEITHYVAIKEDITLRRKTEEELQRAKEAAIAASRSKSQFVANMSHEIRTPMTAIIGLSHLLLKAPLSTKNRRKVQQIASAADGLLGIINSVLDFSKIEAGKLELETIEFDITKVLDHVGVIIGERARKKSVEFVINQSRDIPTHLKGDPLRLRQVLLNLVGNAVKFTDVGEVVLRIEKIQQIEDSVVLSFVISDTGIGISPDKMQSLFEPFSQEDSTITRKYGGTGLGLSISKHIIEKMGGTLSATSSPGIGSIFNFSIEFQIESKRHRQIAIPNISRLRVWLVDDHIEVRDAVRRLFLIYTESIELFSTGCDLLLALDNAQKDLSLPDAIVVDYYLPDMTASKIALEIKKRKLDGLPIIVFSGKNEEEIRDDCIKSGIVEIFTKPITHSVANDILMNIWNQTIGKKSIPVPAVYSSPITNMYRILIAEDNTINAEVATELLEAEGYVIELVANGNEAVEKIVSHVPSYFSCVLMDLHMPVLSGFEACRKIRKLPEFEQLPIIALSANVVDEVRQEVFESGFQDFISKPIQPEILFNHLFKWCSFSTPEKRDSKTTFPKARHGDSASFECIDTQQGLKNMNGNARLYRKTLYSFATQHDKDVQLITQCILSGNLPEARRLLHTLKGLSATIGANRVYGAAMALENEGLAEENIDNDQLNILQVEMERVISEIQRIDLWFRDAKPNSTGEKNIKYLYESLKILRSNLLENDLNAENQFEKIQSELMNLFPADKIRSLETEIISLHYETASEIVADLLG